MQNDAYDSKAIPMSMKSKDYSNGKLDVAYIDKRIDKEMTIDEGFKYLLDKRTAKQLGYREGIDVLPTTKLVQHVDKDAVVAAGLVSASDTARVLKDTVIMVNEPNPNNGGKVEPHMKRVIMDMTNKRIEDIKIDLSKKSYLGKQDLFILDIIRSNKDWKTPIYFAVTVGRDSYLGLDQYLELEGMAYRLVPYKTQGGVNTEVMYDNMMNKFEWGNVSQPGIYMDENNCRMARTFRHMFVRLASELAEEGKKDKAIEVLDKCMKEIPTYNVPADLTSCNIAHLYAGLGEKEKAEAIIDEIFEICKQYRVWNKSLTKEQRKSASEDINERFDMMRYVAATAAKACSKEKADEIRKEAEDFYQEVEQ
jgi:tetratricopeptide (TPR) repeat protein